jgi:hypothetical protein
VQAERYLETAHHCLIRQFHALSRLGLHGADLSLGETVLETMLSTQELIVKDKERLERGLGLKTAHEHNVKPESLQGPQDDLLAETENASQGRDIGGRRTAPETVECIVGWQSAK